MHGVSVGSQHTSIGEFNARYVSLISWAAAMGGLLFGYDWVVIGGAKPFYEKYFHLDSEQLIGWANSCALLGCLLGSMVAGWMSDRFGRKRLLVSSAVLFAVSSELSLAWLLLFSHLCVGGLWVDWRSASPRMCHLPISPKSVLRAGAAGSSRAEPDDHRHWHPSGASGELADRRARSGKCQRRNDTAACGMASLVGAGCLRPWLCRLSFSSWPRCLCRKALAGL